MEEAVSAAYTFLVGNPEHEVMQSNVKYYESLDNVEAAWFKDLEVKPYQVCVRYYQNRIVDAHIHALLQNCSP